VACHSLELVGSYRIAMVVMQIVACMLGHNLFFQYMYQQLCKLACTLGHRLAELVRRLAELERILDELESRLAELERIMVRILVHRLVLELV
jgi:hypothetical protein